VVFHRGPRDCFNARRSGFSGWHGIVSKEMGSIGTGMPQELPVAVRETEGTGEWSWSSSNCSRFLSE